MSHYLTTLPPSHAPHWSLEGGLEGGGGGGVCVCVWGGGGGGKRERENQ